MAATIQFLPFLSFFFLLSSSFITQSSSNLTPQNIQVFYPFPLPPPSPPPPLPPPEITPTDTPTTTTTTPTPTTTPPSKSTNKTVATAVAATAASTLVLSGLFFLLLVKYKRYQKVKEKEKEKEKEIPGGNDNSNTQNPGVLLMNHFTRFEGIKGVIVDEQGLDVLYWKNLEDDESKKTIFKKEVPRINEKEEKKMMTVDHGSRRKSNIQIQEVPLLREKSSASHVWPSEDEIKIQNSYNLPVANQEILKSQLSSRSPPPTPPTPPPAPPPPGVVGRNMHVPPPPLPPKTGGLTLTSSSALPPPSTSQVKLKPLHWDKVNANVDHPTAWDKLGNGSFR